MDLTSLFPLAFEDSPHPELSLTNLERWLAATTSPRLHLEHLLEQPQLARMLIMLMGASQPMADCLIQNPELASIVLDEQERLRMVRRKEVESAGRALVKASTSYSHALDRLRFLRQRWMLSITVNDLCGSWPQEEVWRRLSELADALITLTLEVSWEHYVKGKELSGPCPFMVVAFGKLGGFELNYSSDIDLAYVGPDDQPELLERFGTRFCEAVGRALSDRMGRGMLYRVDLRLRPYGKAGPLMNSMRSVEDYYRLHAESWEIQALIRSRPICGPSDLAARWEQMRADACFKPALSEFVLEQLLESHSRTEALAKPDDLKRGKGGIRDVEFVTQVLQMLHGGEHESLRVRPTCDAARNLAGAGALTSLQSETLVSGYTLLRKVEHRCQLEGETQTHSIPEDESARQRLAHTMGLPGWHELDSVLGDQRRKIQGLFEEIVASGPIAIDTRGETLNALGNHAGLAVSWLDSMPECHTFYRTLASNESSLSRIDRILTEAPKLVPLLKESVFLTESIISGEIEEEFDAVSRIDGLPTDSSLNQLAATYSSAWLQTVTRWAVSTDFELSRSLARLQDSLLRHCARRLYAEFSIVALGSYGRQDLGVESDADLLLLVETADRHTAAEEQAQGLLAIASQLRRHGAPLVIDLRLRPEGKQGLLARTYDGLKVYELEAMEMWERFALGQSRLVYGAQSAASLTHKVAYAQPLTPERLQELLDMKRRIENERVQPRYIKRHVKLGHGGLSDIEWFVHIYEMRYPTATRAGAETNIPDRVRTLARASLVNAVESEELIQAWQYLILLRDRLALLGVEDSVLPENPDRLEILAGELGFEDGNSLLRGHERVVQTVRSIYTDGMDRLKARA